MLQYRLKLHKYRLIFKDLPLHQVDKQTIKLRLSLWDETLNLVKVYFMYRTHIGSSKSDNRRP